MKCNFVTSWLLYITSSSESFRDNYVVKYVVTYKKMAVKNICHEMISWSWELIVCPEHALITNILATSIIFWSKIRTFFNLCSISSALVLRSFSCQNYGRRLMCVGGNAWKLIKNCNKLQFVCDVIDDVTFISHTSFESPLSEVLLQWFFWRSDDVVAPESKMNKNLKIALERHQVS